MCGLQAVDSYQAPGGAITMVNKFGQKYHCEFPPKVSLTPFLCPEDPYVFGPPSQKYGSGSESFYLQAKIVRKTLIPTVL
jgi:hypothetical protein